MISSKKLTWAILLSLVACLALIGLAWAGTAGFALDWHVIGAGGGKMASNSHAINGTLGQLAIGPAQSTGYAIGSGYWYGIRVEAGPPPLRFYLPLLTRATLP